MRPVFVEFCIDTESQLSRILGVSTAAVRKAVAAGRIGRRPDGIFDLFAVVNYWRIRTSYARQGELDRAPWLQVDVPLTRAMVEELIRRAREEEVDEIIWVDPQDIEVGLDIEVVES